LNLLKEKAIIDLISDQSLADLSKNICPTHHDDLLQEIALLVLEMPEEKWNTINEGGWLKFYVVRTMLNMATSPRSTFARKHGLHQKNIQIADIPEAKGYDWDKEDDLTIIEHLLDSYHWYDKAMIQLWLKEGSYRKAGKRVDIPFKSVGNTVRKTLNNLRKDYYGIILERLIGSGSRFDIHGDTSNRPKDKNDTHDT
jgi:DNA-directed RNA polymerase specialized sigma24 family protein